MTILSRLQDAPVGTRELDAELWDLVDDRPRHDLTGDGPIYKRDAEDGVAFDSPPAYTTSLDAALALAERVLPPEWTWRVECNGFGYFAAFWSDPEYAPEGEAIAHTPALALCAAIIAAKEGT